MPPADITAAISRLVVEHSPDCIKLVDEEGRLVWVNERGCLLLEIPDPSAVIGRAWTTLWPAAVHADLDRAVRAARLGGAGRFTGGCPTFSGAMKWWDVVVVSVPAASGDPRLLLSLSREVTELVAAVERERALTAAAVLARDRADRIARQKEDLLAAVSHELRSPLNALLSWAALLQVDTTDPRSALLARRIEATASEQILVVDQLLEAHRSDTVQAQLICEPVRLTALALESLNWIRPLADASGLTLALESPGVDDVVSADSRRLRQVFLNLLSNAVKFTQAGGSIGMTIETSAQECTISVWDNGIGVSPDCAARVFDRYFQEDRADVRRHGGLGLGLNLARQVIELHGGRIAVDSRGRGEGSRFVVGLPRTPTSRSAVRA